MDTATHEKRVSAAPRGAELLVFVIATVLLMFATLAFVELLLIFAVTIIASMILAHTLTVFEDRITGKVARFALAIAILGVVIAALAGLVAGTMSSLESNPTSSADMVLDALITAMFLGGVPTLLAGAGLGAYFARIRGAGRARLAWVATELSVFATLIYLVSVVLYALVKGTL